MVKTRISLLLTTCLVTFVAIANLVRLFWNLSITIGPLALPGWTGAFFFLGLGLLAAWSFREIASFYPPPSNPSNP